MAVPYVPYDGPIVTRDAAQEAGLKRYFEGATCKRGHIAERWVKNQQCMFCNYRTKKPGVPESWKAAKAAWKAANIEKVRAFRRAGYQRNKVKENAWNEAWRAKNIEKRRVHLRNYRAKLRDGGTHTADDIAEIYKLQRGKCAYCRCGLKDGYHVDHIVAVANGGSNTRGNLQLACGLCNRRKSNADAVAFARRIGLLI